MSKLCDIFIRRIFVFFVLLYTSPMVQGQIESFNSESEKDKVYTSDDIKASLQRARTLFMENQCGDAIRIWANQTLWEKESTTEHMRIFEMWGICSVKLGDEQTAVSLFDKMLSLDSEVLLDPFWATPRAQELFQIQKRQMKTQLEESAIAKSMTQMSQHPMLMIEKKNSIRSISDVVILLPIGIPQFLQNRPSWGTIWATVQGISLVVNISAYWTTIAQQRQTLNTVDKVTAQQVAWAVHVAALGTLTVSYVAGVVDAWMHRSLFVKEENNETVHVLQGENSLPWLLRSDVQDELRKSKNKIQQSEERTP